MNPFFQRQRELLGRVVAESDVVITAAVVPGKKPPVLITREMVESMAPGSVIVDLAAERGGNCELTKPGQRIVEHGVTIIGYINVASTVPYHASQMYAKNLTAFLLHLGKEGKLQLNLEDEITRETLLTRGGEVVNARVREFFSLPALPRKKLERQVPRAERTVGQRTVRRTERAGHRMAASDRSFSHCLKLARQSWHLPSDTWEDTCDL